MKLTPEELIAMAHEAGASIERWMTNPPKVAGVHMSPEQLEVLASLVSARTREECAKVCDSKRFDPPYFNEWEKASDDAINDCAAAIRAIGERT